LFLRRRELLKWWLCYFKYRFNKEDDFKEIAVIIGEKKNILEDHLIGLSKGERKEININNNFVEIEISEIKKS